MVIKVFFLKVVLEPILFVAIKLLLYFLMKKNLKNLKLRDFESQISAIFNDSFNNQ